MELELTVHIHRVQRYGEHGTVCLHLQLMMLRHNSHRHWRHFHHN